jgi:dihydrofolate synthase/folylpolyglutamate synthase
MTKVESMTLDDWLDHIGAVHPRDIDMGLDRVATVAARLDVVRPAPVTVIVAGTNGKGSTCVALEQLLGAAGHRVGTTLSPHVDRFNERIRLHGGEIGDAEICSHFEAVERTRGDLPLTYFEFSALAALLAFKSAEVEVAILEVGLGGRLDAFNLVDADLAIVTSIGLDHEDYLGNDLETIGLEKAGVFRPGQTVVLGQVTDSVHQAAADLCCRVHALGMDLSVTEQRETWSCECRDPEFAESDIPRGVIAPVNAALALTAAACLFPGTDWPIEALPAAGIAGRMEGHSHDGVSVLLDVAHNPAAAEFLANQLRCRFGHRRFVGIIATLAGKDTAGVALALDGPVTRWLAVPSSGWRAQSAQAVAAELPAGTEIMESMDSALDRAASLTSVGDGILVVGSFSAVEQARTLLIRG